MQDKYGEVVVIDAADKRILNFSSTLQQSAIYIDKPWSLLHEYTQTMLLGFAFVDARSTLILGLGGGGLVSCLSYYFPQINIDAVEIRQSVIDVAYEWFSLPCNENVKIICDDASDYIQRLQVSSIDIIFSDLYEAQGMSEMQRQREFITDCYNALNVDGCLAINYHELADDSDVITHIITLFSEVFVCDVFKGNWVLFCIKSDAHTDDKVLKLKASGLEKKVDLPMKYYCKQLRKLSL